nr:hypothetical protein [Tanacetum cinerariifolium]
MQTQTSNTLHNAIMEAGGKDCPPMLAPDIRDQLNAEAEAVQIILIGIDNDIYSTIDPCPNACEMRKAIERLKQGESINVQDLETNLYWEFGYGMVNHLNRITQDIRDQLNAEAEAVQIILIGIDNDIYSTIDPCPNACEMRKAIERLKQGESINVQDLETNLYWEFGYGMMNHLNRITQDDEMSKDKEIDKLMALISLSFKKIYKPTNNNLRTSSNTSRANQDNSPRINRGAGYDNQRLGNVARARETVDTAVVQKSGIQCYNYKEFGHVARECQKPKRAKDAAYHNEKMLLCKQEEAGIQLNADQADWRDDNDDESEDQELEVSNDDHYNVFTIESEHPEQSKSVHDTYPIEQDEHKVIIDSLDMNEVTNLQCDYLELLEKCECLENELSKSKMMSKSFEALQKHAINLEIDLQQCHEKIKNDKSFKENQSKEFRKEREQYFEIQDLKAQLQDKGIVISKLKKLIENLKGKSVDTKFEKSSVIRQPNAFKSQRPSILEKPTIFSDSLERKDFSKSKSVTKNNVSNNFSKPVTAQILPPNKKSILKSTNVLTPGMHKLCTEPT